MWPVCVTTAFVSREGRGGSWQEHFDYGCCHGEKSPAMD